MLNQLKALWQKLQFLQLKIQILRSPFFDDSWYKHTYADTLSTYHGSLVTHYLSLGWQLGFDPAPNFSTNGYFELNPDVKESGSCPLVHYLLYGIKEHRRICSSTVSSSEPSPLFDGAIDAIASGYIQGWVHSAISPDVPVAFKLLLEDVEILRSTASLYREDLYINGIGSGHHAFFILNDLPVSTLEGKTLQLVSLNNEKIGRPFVVPLDDAPLLAVKNVRAERFLLIFDIEVKQSLTITFQLFIDSLFSFQFTKKLRVGVNQVTLPVSPELIDGKKHGITLGMLDSQLPLLHQDMIVPTEQQALEQYFKRDNINNKPVIVMIDRSTPKPDQDAGSFAAVQEISLIQSLGFHVVFVPDDFIFASQYTEHLQTMGVDVLFSPIFSSSKEALIAKLPDACAVYITRFNTVEKHIETIKTIAPEIPVIFNNADLHFLREIRQANFLDDDVLLKRALDTREREVKVMKRVDAILSYSEFEHAVIASHTLQSNNIHKCPWVVETPEKTASFEERHDVAFLGGYEHLPNVEAVRFFIEDVMPLIREGGFPIKVYIYGSKMPDSFYEYACEDVIIVGYVESVETVYLKHRVFIAPLFFGAGVKGKVLSAAAHGIPCVLSPIAIEATGLVHNVSTLVANCPNEWAEYIIRLYNSKCEWSSIQKNQSSVIKDNYSFEKSKKRMKAVFQSVNLLEQE